MDAAKSFRNFRQSNLTYETRIQEIIEKYSRPGLDERVVNLFTEALTSSDEDESHSPEKLRPQNRTKLKPTKLDYSSDGCRSNRTPATVRATKNNRGRLASRHLPPVLTGYCTKLWKYKYIRRSRANKLKLLNNRRKIESRLQLSLSSSRGTSHIILNHINASQSRGHASADDSFDYDNGDNILVETFVSLNDEPQYERGALEGTQLASCEKNAIAIEKPSDLDSNKNEMKLLNEECTSKSLTDISAGTTDNKNTSHNHGSSRARLKLFKNEDQLAKLDYIGASKDGKSSCQKKMMELECIRHIEADIPSQESEALMPVSRDGFLLDKSSLPPCDEPFLKSEMSLKALMKRSRITSIVENLEETDTSDEEIKLLSEAVSPDSCDRTSKEPFPYPNHSEKAAQHRRGRSLGSSKLSQPRKALHFSSNKPSTSSNQSATAGSNSRMSKHELIEPPHLDYVDSFSSVDKPLEHSSSLADHCKRTSKSDLAFNEEFLSPRKKQDMSSNALASASLASPKKRKLKKSSNAAMIDPVAPLSIRNEDKSLASVCKSRSEVNKFVNSSLTLKRTEALTSTGGQSILRAVEFNPSCRADAHISNSSFLVSEESCSTFGTSLKDIFKRPRNICNVGKLEESDSSEDEIILISEESSPDLSAEFSKDSRHYPSFSETVARLKSRRYKGLCKISGRNNGKSKTVATITTDSENNASPTCISNGTRFRRGGSNEQDFSRLKKSNTYSKSTTTYHSTSRMSESVLSDSYYIVTSDSENRLLPPCSTATGHRKKCSKIKSDTNLKKPGNTGTSKGNMCLLNTVSEAKTLDGQLTHHEETARHESANYGKLSSSLRSGSAVSSPSKQILLDSYFNVTSELTNDEVRASRPRSSRSDPNAKKDALLPTKEVDESSMSSPTRDSAVLLYYNASASSNMLTITDSSRKISIFS